ncbi:hypothetical protein UlMin_006658 [Ulmus minor]
METSHPKPHAIMFPLPYQGHVTPCIHLAMKLASKGFTITFINTQKIHHQIAKSQPNNSGEDIFREARRSGLDIRYKTISDGLPMGFDRMKNHEQFMENQLSVLPALVDELVGSVIKADPSVSCLIADSFFVWNSHIANKYNLVNISFWTEPALVFNLYYFLDLLKVNGHYASKDNKEDIIDYIPGVKAINPKDLTSFLQEKDTTKNIHPIIEKAFGDVKNADIIIINTVEELEPDSIKALTEKQLVYTLGPVFPFENGPPTKTMVPTNMRTQLDCSKWLDTKPDASVLYISFGSFIPAKKNDILEIAHGISLSKVNFIWVLRSDAVSYDESFVLPPGFEEETKERGLIVPWCNQIEVLFHRAVGGFLTHCGWNSILEGVWCGVPLLCFPLLADQPTNRKLVVGDWKFGLDLCDGKPLTSLEVAEKIDSLMNGELGEGLRKETMKVGQTLRNAWVKDGSSEKNLCRFTSELKAKIVERHVVSRS